MKQFVNETFFSDRFRTAINVFGDSIGCGIVQHLSRKELQAQRDNEQSQATATTDSSDISSSSSSSNSTEKELGNQQDEILQKDVPILVIEEEMVPINHLVKSSKL